MNVSLPEIPDIDAIRRFLRSDPARYLYILGDLDPAYRQHSAFYTVTGDNGDIRALASTFEGLAPYTISLCGAADAMAGCLAAIPRREGHFRLKCSAVHLDLLPEYMTIVARDSYQRLVFKGNPPLERDPGVIWLTPGDLRAIDELLPFYPRAYITPQSLTDGHYLGIWREGKLVALAGTHLLSEQERVAALGTVITHPHYRGQGYATRIVAQMVRDLSSMVDIIGLQLYRKLGFEVHNEFETVNGQWK